MRNGQILVIVMLVLAAVVTVALSVSSRSVTEVGVSTTQDESSRALEAAQVGLERYLGGVPFPVDHGPQSGEGTLNSDKDSYYVPTATTFGGNTVFQAPDSLKAGDVTTIDLPAGNTAATSYSGVNLCWGNNGLNSKVEVEVYYQNSAGEYLVKRKSFSREGSTTNYPNFINTGVVSSSYCGASIPQPYDNGVGIRFNNPNDNGNNLALGLTGGAAGSRTFFMRVRMLNNGVMAEPVAVQLTNPSATTVFPAQGGTVESIGRSGDTVQRVRAIIKTYDLPPMFDSAIFSGPALVKN